MSDSLFVSSMHTARLGNMHISLRSIAGRNFRAIGNEVRLDFAKLPAGLYFIAGRNEVEPRLGANGAAKSTLFIDLVYWTLTGRTARSQRPGADVENWHSVGSTWGCLEFVLDGVARKIERTRRPNALKIDGQPAQQDQVDGLLPLAEAALRRTLLIDQFSQKFLDLRPEEKSRIFSETLNLDLWVRAANRAGTELSDIEAKSQRARVRLSGIESAYAEARAQRIEAQRRETQFEQDIEKQLAELRNKRKAATTLVDTREEELNTARDYLAEAGSADDERELNDRKQKRRTLQALYVAAVSDDKSAAALLVRMTQQLERYVDTKVCPECGQSVTDKHLRERYNALSAELQEAQSAKKLVADSVVKFAQEAEASDKKIAKLENNLIEYHRRHALVQVAIEKSQSALREFNAVKLQIDTLRDTVNPFTQTIADLIVRVKTLRTERNEQRDHLAQLERIAEIYKFWQRGFREIRLEQIDATLIELEIAANKHAQSLGLDGWEIQFATERETVSGNVSHSFTVSLYPPGQNEPVNWDVYSGGESQRLQLAVTFGLAEVLLTRGGIATDFEVIDEPSIHMSAEGVEDLLECLKERASDLDRRIFVIDHHALSAGSFDGVLVCVKDTNGVHCEADAMMTQVVRQPV